MAPWKSPANAEAEAKAQGNSTLFDCWRRSRAGRPKKSGNLARDEIVVKANDTKKKKKKKKKEASNGGTVRIIGSIGRKKHETKSADSCVSVSMHKTGAVAGDTGPTVFLLQGKNKCANFTNGFLRKNGATEGSTVAMTRVAFMTAEAWEEMTPSIIEGL
jgi:hypothetical protein